MKNINIFNDFFKGLSKERIRQLYQRFREAAKDKNLVIYDTGGIPRVIDVMISPILTTKIQRRFFHHVCFHMEYALKKLYSIYSTNPQASQLLPLTEKEKEWFGYVKPNRLQKFQTIFERIDSNAVFSGNAWQDEFSFLEPNSVGVGGIHYIPTMNEVIQEVVISEFKKVFPKIKIHKQDDLRELLLEELLVHARTLGIRLTCVALIEDQSEPEGTDELKNIAEYFNKKGVLSFAVDPRQLYEKNGEVFYKDFKIDLIYRDCEIDELIAMEKGGDNISVLKKAFYNNRVVSSFGGEFDHKSAWEVFSDSRFKRCFTQKEKRIFKKYIPWTRLIWERLTCDEEGNEIDLIKYIKQNKDRLVIKPNRAYGGQDVTLGPYVTTSVWENILSTAITQPKEWVVQSYIDIKSEEFPTITPTGEVEFKRLFVVTGIAATPSGIGFLGRCSEDRVVNVSRGGGLVPIMLLA